MNVPKKEIANQDHNQDHHGRDLGSEDIHLLHRILLEVLEVVVKVHREEGEKDHILQVLPDPDLDPDLDHCQCQVPLVIQLDEN